MSAPAQTLATGESVQQQYAAKYTPIGVQGQQLFKPLNRTFFQVFGTIASGKSRLVQSAPRAFVFNLDESPTTTPNVRAEIWPLVGSDGVTDRTGKPVRLTFAMVQAVMGQLLAARRSRLPDTPETVIIDSLPSFAQLAVEHTAWMLTNANRRRGEQSQPEIPIEEITHFDIRSHYGGTLYDIANGEIMRLLRELHHVGFGVGVVTQYDRKLVKIGTNMKTGEDIEEERYVLSITDGLATRLWRALDLSILLERRTETVVREQKIPGQAIKTKDGRTLTLPEKVETISEAQDASIIVSRRPELARFLKIRAGVPHEFKVTDWSSLESVFNSTKGE